ncbi:polyketide cyclase / dehydrase and lipid transport [Methylomicrobium sp. Wu6]|uniref:polyketide cyclase / dehydrase and lipid transport n=1 Tax=Methylomicrobium sp. Wu6 TaxID=3107928 RepID=UPI002DD6B72B|nr:polyketide cyclase / dehydrase and lipid transport [Methylomicrobium sp. Wu6]MEC4746942.1 polyketide cyclase / dehydrase and lipid transport [Methylomicrobium sp. Wu6]
MRTSDFSLTTRWLIPAPVEQVWCCLIATERWPSWWRYVARVEETAAGNATSGVDNVRRYLWRTCLPYDLAIDLRVTKMRTYHYLAVQVTGDLIGSGNCSMTYRENEAATELIFVWNVSLVKAWMKLVAGVARPLFVWNHSRVMKSGEQGLIRHLAGH